MSTRVAGLVPPSQDVRDGPEPEAERVVPGDVLDRVGARLRVADRHALPCRDRRAQRERHMPADHRRPVDRALRPVHEDVERVAGRRRAPVQRLVVGQPERRAADHCRLEQRRAPVHVRVGDRTAGAPDGPHRPRERPSVLPVHRHNLPFGVVHLRARVVVVLETHARLPAVRPNRGVVEEAVQVVGAVVRRVEELSVVPHELPPADCQRGVREGEHDFIPGRVPAGEAALERGVARRDRRQYRGCRRRVQQVWSGHAPGYWRRRRRQGGEVHGGAPRPASEFVRVWGYGGVSQPCQDGQVLRVRVPDVGLDVPPPVRTSWVC